ncbi:ribokinase [Herbihabitans rhizosphaerae]|uniref:Ribokinase n=1 Tax=Herbihabitans rhizosphaerae TaxID=1872711 RepID=A0A4Q7KMW8_9PSEU|nr:ribokinase [Herbihabitans rhizosphaerae]RZS37647.1 ribokinase [Herbihabitans rhizosphaerae]
MTADVIVVGSANADLVVKVDRRPGAGETVLGGDPDVLPGGKGANTAVAAAKLGARVALLGAVGTDGHADVVLGSLRAAGVGTDLVRRVDAPTGIAYITITPDGENSIVVSPGANARVAPSDVDSSVLGPMLVGARLMALSLEIPLPVAECAAAVAAEAGVRVVLNLSPVARISGATLSTVDPLVVNEHEAGWLLGKGEEVDPRRLLELGVRSAVVTLGARGAALSTMDSPDEVTHVEAPTVTPVDTTGAGDAFTGALLAELAAGADLRAAVEQAVRVAAISVTRPGAQPSYPTREEL